MITIFALSSAIYLALFYKNSKNEIVKSPKLKINKNDSISSKNDINKSDETLDQEKINENFVEEEYGFQEYRVIANDAFLRNQPLISENSKAQKIIFGDRLFLRLEDIKNGFAKVYFTMPKNYTKPTEQAYYITESVLINQYEFENYEANFSLAPFSGLASKVKKIILNEIYNDGTSYNLTQNQERAKTAIAYGDYDKDGTTDVAVVMDNNEKQISRLLIFWINKATKDPYLAFAEKYSDKVKINSFKKGSKVFMYQKSKEAATVTDESEDENGFSKSPNDGIILKAEDIKIAIIYDNSLQNFKTYYQE